MNQLRNFYLAGLFLCVNLFCLVEVNATALTEVIAWEIMSFLFDPIIVDQLSVSSIGLSKIKSLDNPDNVTDYKIITEDPFESNIRSSEECAWIGPNSGTKLLYQGVVVKIDSSDFKAAKCPWMIKLVGLVGHLTYFVLRDQQKKRPLVLS